MKDRIIEIVELGEPQSLIQRENAPITELITTDLLIEELNEQLQLYNVVGRSEQLNCEHEWKVEAFDCYGMPYEQYCEHCGKKEAI